MIQKIAIILFKESPSSFQFGGGGSVWKRNRKPTLWYGVISAFSHPLFSGNSKGLLILVPEHWKQCWKKCISQALFDSKASTALFIRYFPPWHLIICCGHIFPMRGHFKKIYIFTVKWCDRTTHLTRVHTKESGWFIWLQVSIFLYLWIRTFRRTTTDYFKTKLTSTGQKKGWEHLQDKETKGASASQDCLPAKSSALWVEYVTSSHDFAHEKAFGSQGEKVLYWCIHGIHQAQGSN